MTSKQKSTQRNKATYYDINTKTENKIPSSLSLKQITTIINSFIAVKPLFLNNLGSEYHNHQRIGC